MNKIKRLACGAVSGLVLLVSSCATFYKDSKPTIKYSDLGESVKVVACNVQELNVRNTYVLSTADITKPFLIPRHTLEIWGIFKHDTIFTRCLWVEAEKEAPSDMGRYLGISVKYSLEQMYIHVVGFNGGVINKRFTVTGLNI